MENNNGMIHAYLINAADKIKKVGLNEINSYTPEQGLLWVHMNVEHPQTHTWFHEHSRLYEVVLDGMLADETRPRIRLQDKGMMIILRAMNMNKGADPTDMIPLSMWVDQNRILTTQSRDIRSIEDIVKDIESGAAPIATCEFITRIISRVFESMEFFLEDLEESISYSEAQIVLNNEEGIDQCVAMSRKQITIFRRYIIPQKTVVEKMIRNTYGWFAEKHKEQLVEELDRITRYTEELDELRDRMQILNDEIRTNHSERLNHIAYIFSVVATLFLPLGFLTGLFGINLGGMPSWLNDTNAFPGFIIFCIVLVVLQIVIFKKLKWF